MALSLWISHPHDNLNTKFQNSYHEYGLKHLLMFYVKISIYVCIFPTEGKSVGLNHHSTLTLSPDPGS